MGFRVVRVALGIYASFIAWGYLQERTSTREYVGSDGVARKWDSILVQNLSMALVSALLSGILLRRTGAPPCAASSTTFLPVAVSNSIASPFGYASLSYISFPLLTLSKASKLVPIMLMGLVVGGKRYSRREYLAAACITAGIALFTVKPLKAGQATSTSTGGSGNEAVLGLGLVAINLALDGFTNARQEAIFRDTGCTNFHMMFWLNVHSCWLLGSCLILGCVIWGVESELGRAMAFAAVSPEAIVHVMLFALCGAVGQVFIFTAIQEFGAVVCTTITLTRKFFSILLSIIIYAHPIRQTQWIAILIVFAGLGLQASDKARASGDRKKGSEQEGKKDQ